MIQEESDSEAEYSEEDERMDVDDGHRISVSTLHDPSLLRDSGVHDHSVI